MIDIDTVNFSPLSAFIGGLFIGFAVILYFISTGRIAGVSGIVNNTLTKSHNRTTNLLFLLGLILGPLTYMFVFKTTIPFIITSSAPIIIIGGLLVGIGTKIGSGCTSGHGVCGISRFSSRSILATVLFILSAVMIVFIFKLIGFSS